MQMCHVKAKYLDLRVLLAISSFVAFFYLSGDDLGQVEEDTDEVAAQTNAGYDQRVVGLVSAVIGDRFASVDAYGYELGRTARYQ